MSTVRRWNRADPRGDRRARPGRAARRPRRLDRAARPAPRHRHRCAILVTEIARRGGRGGRTPRHDPARPDARVRGLAPPPPLRRDALAAGRDLPARPPRPPRLRRRGGLPPRLRPQRPRRQHSRLRDRGRRRPLASTGSSAPTAIYSLAARPATLSELLSRVTRASSRRRSCSPSHPPASTSTDARPSPGGEARRLPGGLVVGEPGRWQELDGFTDWPDEASAELGEKLLAECVRTTAAAFESVADLHA